MFARWTLLLAILGFGLSLIGTFIVRSGLLTSCMLLPMTRGGGW